MFWGKVRLFTTLLIGLVSEITAPTVLALR